jgi:hypothetical protein
MGEVSRAPYFNMGFHGEREDISNTKAMNNTRKLYPKVILEGTRLTWKTEIALALNEHPRIVGPRKYRYHSPVISAEWCGFTPFPWGRGLINFRPEEEKRALETYLAWVRLMELLPFYSWIIDRFHISTQVYQKRVYNRTFDFSDLEERLDRLGFRIVFCVRRPGTFEEARKKRLAVSGNPSQYEDLSLFIREQEAISRAVDNSILPVLRLDISDDPVSGTVLKIADWLEKTDGLSPEIRLENNPLVCR